MPMILKYWIWSLFCVPGAALFAIGIVRETLIAGAVIILFNIVLSIIALTTFGMEYVIYCQPIVAALQLFIVVHIFRRVTAMYED